MDEVEAIARRRIESAEPEIRKTLLLASAGNPYAAEEDSERVRARLQRKAALTPKEADTVAKSISASAAPAVIAKVLGAEPASSGDFLEPPPGAELAWGDTLDFVNVGFLAKGAQVARAVGRVAFRSGRPQGSGFLIGPGLFLTNNHVIGNPEIAQQLVLELDYELDLRGLPRSVSRFSFDTSVFITDPVSGLDFTLIGVGPPDAGAPNSLEVYGWCGLTDARDKHMLGEFANIVQHPQGRHKEVVLRENRLVSRFDDALHYVADTEPGSSGSPVFNSEWDVIALHHWGGPWIQKTDDAGAPLDVEINEGVRISSIVKRIREALDGLEPIARGRVASALQAGAQEYFGGDEPAPAPSTLPRGVTTRLDPDGRVTWTIPLEVSVHIPQLARPATPDATRR